MKKIKSMGFLIIILGLFLAAPRMMDAQFPITTVCQPPLTTFSDGSATFDISFPPGGGTTCDTVADCPTISLPAGATVFSVKVDMKLSDPASEIGTPYLWVPISVANGYIAQIDTKDGFEAEIARYKVGNNPSRTFVIPGGDVWVANRDSGNVTKLSPLTGDQPIGGTCGDGLCGKDETIYSCPADCNGNICGDGIGTCKNNIACGIGTENCREYKVVDSYPTGAGPRGVTGDINGNVWVANRFSSNVVKLNPATGAVSSTVVTGGEPYGLIADQFGYVWVSNVGVGVQSVQSINIITETVDKTVPITSAPYGIGIDADGNILVASCTGATANKINGYGTGVPGTIAFSKPLVGGASTRGRGIASDLNGNIWVGSDNGGSGTVYSFKPSGAQYCPFYNPSPQHNTVGVAVDFNNNVWVVPYDGNVLKLKPDNEAACTSVTHVTTVFVPGGLLYNYSDMTGLRTIPQNLRVSGSSTGTPLSSTGTFEICTDGTGTCTSGLPCAAITAILSSCVPNAAGNCEIPLKIFSITAGDYTLSNLEVIYGKEVPVTIGGLVPCDRDWDDPRTPWNEKAPCNFCFLLMMINNIMNFLLMLAAGIAVLALIITGLLFVTSSGDSERKSQSKTALKYSVWGFIVIFISWIIVDFLLIGWGYLDPLGGEWNIVDCDVSQTFCGDNIRQTPNDYGFNEECDGTDNPCAGVCSSACTCTFVPPPPPPPCTDTCASLGYECGTQTVCGVATNCGSCVAPNVCNALGKCTAPLPASFDWSHKVLPAALPAGGADWMSPVRNQGGCWTCSIFSAVGAVEGQYNIEQNSPNLDKDLAERYLVSTCFSGGACYVGSWPDWVLKYIRDDGITSENCFPYSASDCNCNLRCATWSSDLWKIGSYTNRWIGTPSEATPDEMKNLIVNHGPLSGYVRIDNPGDGFVGGIYRCAGSAPDHAIVIVGYNDAGSYWIVKNSWGSTWPSPGGNGYYKVGYGECGIEGAGSYGVHYATGVTSP